MKVKIIYYAYLYGPDWPSVVQEQLGGLRALDLYNKCDGVWVNASGSDKDLVKFKDLVAAYSKAVIDRITTENQFEYPGIKSLYDHAMQDGDALYLYFHTKGIVSKAHKLRRKLFKYTISNYQKYFDIFNSDPAINLMGVCPSINKWIWFNFFWVRGACVQTCDPPIIKSRHYYESWIGRNNLGQIKVCDFTGDFKALSPREAGYKISTLP